MSFAGEGAASAAAAEVVEIYYAMPADFGVFGKGVQQEVIDRYRRNLDWEVDNLRRRGATDIRWYAQDSNVVTYVEGPSS